ncbi:MAG TPA: hypothetical protein VHO70_14495 [Chitinispirillaceae bacterium]|nr:hypothetical protein [Chitinispirillaceae bacterium]
MKNNATTNSHLKSLSTCNTAHNKESIDKLEQDIVSLEEELRAAESNVRTIKSQIQARYHNEIVRIHDLYSLYKSQKRLKKDKRLDQKKRGKNYKEPTGLKKVTKETSADSNDAPDTSHELKKLYREAVVQVHPDKFINHPAQISKRSLELTIQLIDIYQSGNLEKLKQAHRHIMSGNAMAECHEDTSKIPDPAAMKEYLVRKRDTLVSELTKVKESYFYQVVTASEDHSKFIDNMATQFYLRIKQLERRTRS